MLTSQNKLISETIAKLFRAWYNGFKYLIPKEEYIMGKPKKQTSPRKTGLRRNHLVLDLARKVNAKSPVKVATTRRETGKKV
jgi:hypothetical protein